MINEADMHPLAWQYLEQLRGASLVLPSAHRTELIADIESHLAESTTPTMSNAAVLNVIDKLGDPDEIIAAAADSGSTTATGAQPPMGTAARQSTTREWITLALLMFGAVVSGLGWIAGVILLWTSKAWDRTDKWLGTLLVPGGFITGAIVILIGLGQRATRTATISLGGSAASDLDSSGFGTLTANGPLGEGASISSHGNSVTIHAHGVGTGSAGVWIVIGLVLIGASIYTAVRLARHARLIAQ